MRYRTRPRTAYLAARFERKEELQAAEARLEEECSILPGARWLNGETDMRGAPDDDRRQWANMNMQDVLNADILITFSEDLTDADKVPELAMIPFKDRPQIYAPAIWARGGRHVEFGLALGMGISIAVIGPKENLFHYTDQRSPKAVEKDAEAQINHFDTLDAFIEWYQKNNELPEDAEFPDNETRPTK